MALQQGHDRVVATLLERDTRSRGGLPALHVAARKDDVNAANLLLMSPDANVNHQSQVNKWILVNLNSLVSLNHSVWRKPYNHFILL